MDTRSLTRRSGSEHALLFHGFTGDPTDVEPITKMLSSHDWNCSAPVLPGHENGFQNIGVVSWREWLAKAEEEAEALSRRCQSFSVVGFSMGGLLAAYIANRYPVERVVLLNAAVIYLSPLRYLTYFLEKFRSRDLAHFRRAARIPRSAVREFIKLSSALRREFRYVRQPTLICQSGRDQIVHPHSARYLQRVIPGQTTVATFPRSTHVICWDVERLDVVSEVEQFLIHDGSDRSPSGEHGHEEPGMPFVAEVEEVGAEWRSE